MSCVERLKHLGLLSYRKEKRRRNDSSCSISECLHLNNMAQKHPPTEDKRKVMGLNSSKKKLLGKAR